tara:strand:- start:427 stop:981 length:555 start_codon:yes stop_codon:yes gene_type:complete
MAKIGTFILLGLIIGSISFSLFLFLDTATITVISESGGAVIAGDVKFYVEHIGNYEILKKTDEYSEAEKNLVQKGLDRSEIPEGVYFQIQINAHNTGDETVRVTGGQFYLYDTNNEKHEAVFIGYGEEELSVIDLKPNETIVVTTQFDIPYDEEMKYTIGIIPNKYGLQDAQERIFVCVKHCEI